MQNMVLQNHRESVMYDDHPLNALNPWGRKPVIMGFRQFALIFRYNFLVYRDYQLTADGQQWHYFTDPAEYR